MRRNLLLFLAVLASLSVGAQNVVRGVVRIAGTGEPAAGATVTLQGQQATTTTDVMGNFVLEAPESGDDVLTISLDNYDVEARPVTISELEPLNLGTMTLMSAQEELAQELTEEAFLASADIEFDDEDGLSSQTISGLLYSKGDVFTGAAAYGFSAARYRVRGYAQNYESTYINGINFNEGERGRFNFSSIGGLNYAMRNKETVNNFAPNDYTYGNLGNTTNINVRASQFARGGNVSLAGTNRAYWLRAQATYATGLMSNGWAFVISGSYRWSHEGRNAGTFYNAGGLFISAQKVFNSRHSLNIAAYAAPTERAGSSALTQETVDLTRHYSPYGEASYNPYWGWYEGKKRNSRIVNSIDPTLLLNYDFNISDVRNLKIGLAAHYSMYSNSALTFYNAPDPRPDYYRNLPSTQLAGWGLMSDGNFYHDADYLLSGGDLDFNGGNLSLAKTNVAAYKAMQEMWRNGNTKGNTNTQLDWGMMYNANYANNLINPNGMAKYMLERRHNNLLETALNATYKDNSVEHLNIVAGIEAKYTMGRHYKTVDDLMGANQWFDIDPFSDRDINDLAEDVQMTQADVARVRLNDLDDLDENGNAKIKKNGDVFGYNYDLNIVRASAFMHNAWDFNNVEFYYGIKLTETVFQRYGRMNNGRAWYLTQQIGDEVISKGAGRLHTFFDPSLKAGVVYKFNGHHRIFANVLAETRAPYTNTFYTSQRIHDRSIDNTYAKYNSYDSRFLQSFGLQEKILSYDLNYVVTYPWVRARLSLYRTHSIDGIESNGYYNDEYRTFINHQMYGVNKIYQGGELGASFKLNGSFTLSAVLAFNEGHYTNNPIGVESAENGMRINGKQESVDRIILNPARYPENDCLKYDENKKLVFDDATSKRINAVNGGKAVKLASGPQLAAMIKLNYFHDKMWFADLSISYYDMNYLGVAPTRFSRGIVTGSKMGYYDDKENVYTPGDRSEVSYVGGGAVGDAKQKALATQESLFAGSQWYNHIMIDASVGKLIYLKNNRAININLSVNNITNNTGMKTGGWQQARIPTTAYRQQEYKVSDYVNKYPSKFYYAWGFNFFLNVGFRF